MFVDIGCRSLVCDNHGSLLNMTILEYIFLNVWSAQIPMLSFPKHAEIQGFPFGAMPILPCGKSRAGVHVFDDGIQD